MNKIISKLKEDWKIIIFILFIVIPLFIIVPYIIGYYFPIFPVFINVGYILTFYAGVLTFSGTVFLGYISYNQNTNILQNNIKTIHLAKRPYLSVTQLLPLINDRKIPSHELTHNGYTSFTGDFDVNISQKKQKYNIDFNKTEKIYYIVYHDNIEIKKSLSTNHQENILDNFRSENGDVLHHLFFPLEIENIGGGSCLNLRYSLSSSDTTNIEDRLSPPPIPLAIHSKMYIGIYFKNATKNKLVLDFIYQDIFNNGFKQSYKIICLDEVISMDFISLQEPLKEKQLNQFFKYKKKHSNDE